MSLDDVLSSEAEQSAYAQVISKRIGELVAEKIDVAGFLNASDDDLRNMAMTILLLVMNELGDEAIGNATETAKELGFPEPTEDQLARVRQAALEANVNRLYTALEEQRAKGKRSAGRNRGLVPASLDDGTTAALAIILADAAQGLATDLPVEVNAVMAEAASFGTKDVADPGAGDGDAVEAADGAAAADSGGDAGTDDESAVAGIAGALTSLVALFGAAQGNLTWVTRYDDNVCQEDGPAVTTPSGGVMPEGAGTSCEGRHGITLPSDDWISEGFPRDARLLCSRFGRPRCRCLLATASVRVPSKPLNIAPAIARGKAAGEAEQLDLTDAHLNGLSVTATGQKASPDLWNLSIRVSKRTAVLVGAQ